MTVIEFFDKSPIENILSSFTMNLDKIIFIGREDSVDKSISVYRNVFIKKGMNIKMEYRSIKENDLEAIEKVLSEIVEAEKNGCAFDLTGGDDMFLVAVGIIFQKYKNEKILQMHRFNIENGVIYDCDKDGKFPCYVKDKAEISLNEWISLYGGLIAREATEERQFFKDHETDINSVWNFRKAENEWNASIGRLSRFQSYRTKMNVAPLAVKLESNRCSNRIEKYVSQRNALWSFLRSMRQKKLLSSLTCKNNFQIIFFEYQNELIKKCFSKQGEILELKILQILYNMEDGTGNPYFCDIKRGVSIDWDGEIKNNNDTENEIDLIAMCDLVPVFISCKNGAIGEVELYKLHTVASRFGGKHVKKILISSESGAEVQRLKGRARDMNITIIDGVAKEKECSDAFIAEQIKKVFS